MVIVLNKEYGYVYVERRESPFHYRWEPLALPSYIKLTIEKEGDSKQAYVHSKIHLNKRAKAGPMYSLDYNDKDILKEIASEILCRWVD